MRQFVQNRDDANQNHSMRIEQVNILNQTDMISQTTYNNGIGFKTEAKVGICDWVVRFSMSILKTGRLKFCDLCCKLLNRKMQ